jgi:NADH-quinone oxidoreductase subunit L
MDVSPFPAFRLLGIFSKDEILTAAYGRNPVYFIIGLAGAMITAFYMFRLYATTFRGTFRGTPDQQHHLHESPSAMTIPLIVLAILSVVGGFIGMPEVMAPQGNMLENFLQPVFASGPEQTEKIPASTEWMLMGISTVLSPVDGAVCTGAVQQES